MKKVKKYVKTNSGVYDSECLLSQGAVRIGHELLWLCDCGQIVQTEKIVKQSDDLRELVDIFVEVTVVNGEKYFDKFAYNERSIQTYFKHKNTRGEVFGMIVTYDKLTPTFVSVCKLNDNRELDLIDFLND